MLRILVGEMTLIPNLPTDEGRELGAQFDRFCRVELADRQSRGDTSDVVLWFVLIIVVFWR